MISQLVVNENETGVAQEKPPHDPKSLVTFLHAFSSLWTPHYQSICIMIGFLTFLINHIPSMHIQYTVPSLSVLGITGNTQVEYV